VDSPIQMYDSPVNHFVAGFIGTPQMNFFDGRICSGDDGLVFDGPGGMRLPVPEDRKIALEAYCNRPVILGMRPEDIGSAAAEQLAGAPRIRALIEVVEPMGSESYVHFKIGATAFVSRVDAHRTFQVGQTAEPAVFIGNAHFFDPRTDSRIGATRR